MKKYYKRAGCNWLLCFYCYDKLKEFKRGTTYQKTFNEFNYIRLNMKHVGQYNIII